MQGNYFYVSHFLISHNRSILVSFKLKLEIKDNLSCYCFSVKDIIFGRQIPRTILTVEITVGSMQRMKINFSFPKGVSTHGHTKLKGLKQKISFTSSWYNSYYLKETFWNTSRLHAAMHEGCRHNFNWSPGPCFEVMTHKEYFVKPTVP